MNIFWEKFFYIFTWLCQGSSYLSPRAYGILHRMHHAYSDTEKDPHSPHHADNLFLMMWKTKDIYNEYFNYRATPEERFSVGIPEWRAFDLFADSYISRISWGTAYVLFYIAFAPHWLFFALLPIHFLMGPVHGAIVNWSGHMYGYSNFDNNDKSKNSLVLDFLMLGELFQNNHHKLPKRANFAVKWFEFDPTYPVVKLLHFARIIKLKEA